MAYTYKQKIANRNNYGGLRNTSKIKYIVWHYTGNDGDTDENNGLYFQRNIVKASAHYFVDSNSVTQSVPDDYVAWSVGGSKYSDCSKTGGGKLYKIVTNTNSLSIELCDDVKNGVVYPSTGTIANALELTKKLMKKYGIPASHVIRHFDVTGKRCPAYWCGSSAKDKLWADIKLKLGGAIVTEPDDEKLNVDGEWGCDTTEKSQIVFGTYCDGKISNQPSSNKKYLPNCHTSAWEFKWKNYKGGSAFVKSLQLFLRKLKYYAGAIDGYCGKQTVTALQMFLKKLGYYTGAIDGYMGRLTVIAWQLYINSRL